MGSQAMTSLSSLISKISTYFFIILKQLAPLNCLIPSENCLNCPKTGFYIVILIKNKNQSQIIIFLEKSMTIFVKLRIFGDFSLLRKLNMLTSVKNRRHFRSTCLIWKLMGWGLLVPSLK